MTDSFPVLLAVMAAAALLCRVAGFTLMRLSTDIHKISGSIAVKSGDSRRSPISGPALWLTCRIGVRLADHRGVAGSQTV